MVIVCLYFFGIFVLGENPITINVEIIYQHEEHNIILPSFMEIEVGIPEVPFQQGNISKHHDGNP